MAHDRKNEDQEQISDSDIVGKAASEDPDFDEAEEFGSDDDQDEGEEIEEG